MSHFENSKLAGTKRASPPKSSALKSPPDKAPSFGVVSLRMRDAISEEEDLFARCMDAVHGTSTVAFDPAPAKRASPPKSSALKSPPDKAPSFGVVSLRMRDAISEEEDLFARWLDAVHGRHIPGLSLGEARDDRFE